MKYYVTDNPWNLFWVGLWLLILAAFTIFQSGFYNTDSLKYVTIASHMLDSHQYILPMYQGHPYSDKGPLMFWLFDLGWKLTGINHWWPQLLIGLTASGVFYLTFRLAALFWPTDKSVKNILPWILIGMPSLLVFSNEIRVDIFLVFFCLLSLVGIIKAYQGTSRYWLLYLLALACGFLCKGPVILLYTFIPALIVPFLFSKPTSFNYCKWYGYLVLSTLIAALLTVLWIIPAMHEGGRQFSHQILLGQVYHRALEDSSSYLYYIIRIPIFLLPWLLYSPFLIGGLKHSKIGGPEKFLWFIILSTLIIFTLYGQKRVHYLDPDFPLLALIIAKAISNYRTVFQTPDPRHHWFMGILFLLFAITLLVIPYAITSWNWNPALHKQLYYLMQLNIPIAIFLVALSAFYFWFKPKVYQSQLLLIALPTGFITVLLLILRVTTG